jgi:WD40 repeat protein
VVTSARKGDNKIVLFDDQGMMHQMKGLDQFDTQKVPATGKVTAYSAPKDAPFEAYGMSDGTIWIHNKNGKLQKLIGHLSRISMLKIDGRLLYSSSYDGSVKLWIPTNDKVEPMTLVETNNWIMHFELNSTKNTFWLGDVKGNLTAVNISVPQMIDVIRKKINRNLTTEEWNYYIGQDVPYETFAQ